MKTAYSYIRFSTPDQIKGDSLRRQTEATERFCERHKLNLDKSLSIEDLGTSAFKGANQSIGNLGKFLELVERKQVKKGSVLVVEKLDRLSRQEVLSALHLIERIIRAGVEVGVVDNDKIYGVKDLQDTMTIMMMVMQFATANEESRKKSERISAAWVGKRLKANEKKITGRCPAWLRLAPCRTKFEVIEERAKVIKDIFNWTIEGYGLTAITKRLMATGVKPFEADEWSRSYISKILCGRVVLGEFQPRTQNPEWKPGSGLVKHVPVGDLIQNYFPAIISETVYYKARSAMGDRKIATGKIGVGVPNLFTGLLFNLPDKSAMTLVDKGSSYGKSLVPASAKIGKSKYVSFPYAGFESAMLRVLKELRPKDVMPVATSSNDDQVEKLQTEVAKLETQIKKLKAKLLDDTDFESGLDLLKQLEGRKKLAASMLDKALSENTRSEGSDLKETQSIIDLLSTTDDVNELRTRIKGKLRGLIEGIYIKVLDQKTSAMKRRALANIKLKNGVVKQVVLTGDGSYIAFNYGKSLEGNFSKKDIEGWLTI